MPSRNVMCCPNCGSTDIKWKMSYYHCESCGNSFVVSYRRPAQKRLVEATTIGTEWQSSYSPILCPEK